MKNINKSIIKAIEKEHLKNLILDEIKLNGNECDLNFIDTSDINDMSDLFRNTQFNGNISNWNTSNVENMAYMFYGSKFNKDISNWDTSNVLYINNMFHGSEFNGDISDWDVQKVEDIDRVFYESKSKNIPYWAKIKDYNERIKAYQIYHAQKEKKLILNNIKENSDLTIKPNKEIIKI